MECELTSGLITQLSISGPNHHTYISGRNKPFPSIFYLEDCVRGIKPCLQKYLLNKRFVLFVWTVHGTFWEIPQR